MSIKRLNEISICQFINSLIKRLSLSAPILLAVALRGGRLLWSARIPGQTGGLVVASRLGTRHRPGRAVAYLPGDPLAVGL
jgi:hypothetical protein